MSLDSLQKWFSKSKLYGEYVGWVNEDYLYDLSDIERINFFLLAWHSEGCPEI